MDSPRVLILPGWQNSGPGHWQSLWQEHRGYERVEQHDWCNPLRGDWVARLEDVLLQPPVVREVAAPVVLVAHSLGCQLVAAWAAHSRNTQRVCAALLVAPGDLQRQQLRELMPSWSPPVLRKLPFRSLLLGSQDDPYCDIARARVFAQAWGSVFVDYGRCGHINADSGLGLWPDGHRLLQSLVP